MSLYPRICFICSVFIPEMKTEAAIPLNRFYASKFTAHCWKEG